MSRLSPRLASWLAAPRRVLHALRTGRLATGLAERLADQTARTLAVERRRLAELRSVHELATHLAGLASADELAPQATAAVRAAVLPTTTVAFMSFDQRTASFQIIAESGPDAGVGGRAYPVAVLPPSVRAATIERFEPLLIADTSRAGVDWAALVARFPALTGARTFAIIPLVSRGSLRGAFTLRDPATDALPAQRIDLVRLQGQAVADALTIVASVREAERRAERESLVNRIAQRARASFDPNEVLRRALEELGPALGASRAIVALGTSEDELRVTHEWRHPGTRPLGLDSQRLPLARAAVRDGATVAVRDLSDDARFLRDGHDQLADLAASGVGAAIATPIGARGQLIGALAVHQVGTTRDWTDDECRLLEAVANELRVAMELTRLLDARRRENDRMLALHRVSAVLAAQTDPSGILDEILRSAVRLLDAGAASLFIWVPEAGVLRNVRDHQVPPGGASRTLRPGQGIAGKAFTTVRPHLVNDYAEQPDAGPGPLGAGQRSAIAVPLVRQGEAVGVLALRSYDPDRRFTDEDGHLLTLFADLAAASLVAAEAFEKQRAAAIESERLSRAKSDFVSIVSHEFRTPLTGIQGFSEMIRDDDLALPEIKEYAAEIHREAERLGRMITEMLDLDRMESGRMAIHAEPLDLGALIRTVATKIGPTAPQHPIELRLGGSVGQIPADSDKITQVLTNLIGNAIKYSPAGGPIVVTTVRAARAVEVSIRDHGLGIPPEAREAVFERYSRIESGMTRHIQGTGLGLPIVRQIVDLHGGRAWIAHTDGPGTDVRFSLPLGPAA